MGRKIPGKKHRGIKDPAKQQAERNKKIKHKRNDKPQCIDDQELPRSIQKIAEFKNSKFSPQIPRKSKNRKYLIDASKFIKIEKDEYGMTRPLKMMPYLKQGKNEEDKKFVKRVNNATKMVLKESAFENKFQVDVERNQHGHIVSMKKREYTDPLINDADDKKSKQLLEQREAKRVKNREREKKRKKKKQQPEPEIDESESAFVKELVSFGDIVHEPPKLATEKLAKKLGGNKINTDGFLFMNKIREHDSADAKSLLKTKPSMARRAILEVERQKAVKAYRELKIAKLKT